MKKSHSVSINRSFSQYRLLVAVTTAESSSNTDIKAETSEMVTTEVAKYSNVAINSAKKSHSIYAELC